MNSHLLEENWNDVKRVKYFIGSQSVVPTPVAIHYLVTCYKCKFVGTIYTVRNSWDGAQ